MQDHPFVFDVSIADALLSTYDNHIQRRLSSMRGQFYDQSAYNAVLYVPPRWVSPA